MDILERIIENLTSDEVRRFKILSNRFKADEEKKLIILFDAIRNGGFKDIEAEVVTQLYGANTPKTKNSYYRLRNKLLSNLEKSLLFYHFNYKNTLESHSHIQLAILLKERGLYKEAFHYLKKAEKVAQKHDQFSVVEVIYDEMVQLAARDINIDIDKIIEKRKENLRKMDIQRSTNEILGMVAQKANRLNVARGKKGESLIEMLEQIKDKLEVYKDIYHSPTGRIAVARTVCAILLRRGVYDELEKYIAKTFHEFEEAKLFDRNTHSFRLLMRIWWINALRKLLRISEEAQQIKLLLKDLKMYGKQNYNEYAIYYYTSKINNEKLLGNLKEANATLKEGLQNKSVIQNDLNELYLLISQADQYFNEEKFIQALESLKQIMSHNRFEDLDEEAKFYLSIFELVVGHEAKNFTFTASRYKSLRKKFRKLLGDSEYAKASKFATILMRLNAAGLEEKSISLQTAYHNFISTYPKSEVADNHIIMYEVYLKAKLNKSSYYNAFLREIQKMAT